MKHIMATEAQRLISISLAKIAASRCVRGGVSLHKNLLVATVLQKARYIFMEEAFHMVHGHYINQANSKFIQQLRYQEQLENHLRQSDREYDEGDESTQLDDSELDLFTSPIDSNESRNFLNDSSSDEGKIDNSYNDNKQNSLILPSTSVPDLIYLDLDINSRQVENNSGIRQKRRLSDDLDDNSKDVAPLLPKQIKISRNFSISSNKNESKTIKLANYNPNNNTNNNSNTNNESTDNSLSLDFLSSELNLTSVKPAKNVTMAPLDISRNTSALSSFPTNTTNPAILPTSSSIDRITSLVSIFNFGNLQRSVSAPDLCSSNHSSIDNGCCNLQQRQIAMTV